MEKYYNLKEKNLPKSFGSVVKLKEGKLEAFVGIRDLENFEISLNKKNDKIIGIKSKYTFEEITEYKARKLKEGENNWIIQYNWMGFL